MVGVVNGDVVYGIHYCTMRFITYVENASFYVRTHS